MARRKNVKRIDPRHFLNETVDRLSEVDGETAKEAAERINKISGSMKFSAIDEFHYMKDGSKEMASYYPHVQDLAAFATEVLELLGEV